MRPILYTGVLLMMGAACTGIVAAPDEGAGSSTGVAVCSSQVFWKDLDKGSVLMRPGGKCNECHNKMLGPNYTVAGTVFPTAHEPDDCNGVAGTFMDGGKPEITVVITDKSGRQLEPIPVNSVGNFQLAGQVIMPFNVKVVLANGKENKMVMQAPHGDCNACHTQTGTEGAPGRIFTP